MINKLTISARFFFYLSYCIILLNQLLQAVHGVGEIFNSLYLVLGIPSLIIAALLNVLAHKKNIIRVLILLSLSALFTILIGNNLLMVLCLTILAFGETSFESFLKLDLTIKIPIVFLISILYFYGLTDVNVHYAGNDIVRHSMGAINPNVFSSYIFSITMELVYVLRRKPKLISCFIILLAAIILYVFTYSRTHIICLIFMGVFVLLFEYIKKVVERSRMIRTIICNSAFVFATITLAVVFMYGQSNQIAYNINSQVDGRVKISYVAIQKSGIRPYGMNMTMLRNSMDNWYQDKDVPIDNMYVYTLLSYGPFMLIAALAFISKYNYYLYRNKNLYIIIILFIFSMSGLMEKFYFEPYHNVFLLPISYMLYGLEVNVKDEK